MRLPQTAHRHRARSAREGQADSLDHLFMSVRPRQADQTSGHPHSEQELHRLVDRAAPADEDVRCERLERHLGEPRRFE